VDIEKMLRDHAVLPLWPEVGHILGLSRSSTYKAADDGTIKTIAIGRLKKVSCAWLRRTLELDDAGGAPGESAPSSRTASTRKSAGATTAY
jgi:hypothetical protein